MNFRTPIKRATTSRFLYVHRTQRNGPVWCVVSPELVRRYTLRDWRDYRAKQAAIRTYQRGGHTIGAGGAKITTGGPIARPLPRPRGRAVEIRRFLGTFGPVGGSRIMHAHTHARTGATAPLICPPQRARAKTPLFSQETPVFGGKRTNTGNYTPERGKVSKTA